MIPWTRFTPFSTSYQQLSLSFACLTVRLSLSMIIQKYAMHSRVLCTRCPPGYHSPRLLAMGVVRWLINYFVASTLCESLRSKSAVCKNKFNLSTESECMDGYHGIIDVPACNSQVRWRAVRVLKIEPFIYFRNEISKCFVSVFGLWLSDWLGYCGHGINSTRRILFSYFVRRPIIIVQLPPTRYSSAFWHNTLVSHSHTGWSNR